MVLYRDAAFMVYNYKTWNEFFKCDYSNEGYRAVFYCDVIYDAVLGGSNF